MRTLLAVLNIHFLQCVNMVAGQRNQYGNYMQFEVLLAVIITTF